MPEVGTVGKSGNRTGNEKPETFPKKLSHASVACSGAGTGTHISRIQNAFRRAAGWFQKGSRTLSVGRRCMEIVLFHPFRKERGKGAPGCGLSKVSVIPSEDWRDFCANRTEEPALAFTAIS
jgi:hypothetical protein